MRASEVRAAIAAAITALSAESPAGEGDRFVYIATLSRDPDTAPGRSFRLALTTQPQRADLTTDDAWIVEYQLSVFYPASPDVEDRIGADAELIDIALERLHETNASINNVTCEPAGVDEIGVALLASRLYVVALFRQSEAIL